MKDVQIDKGVREMEIEMKSKLQLAIFMPTRNRVKQPNRVLQNDLTPFSAHWLQPIAATGIFDLESRNILINFSIRRQLRRDKHV
jgi:hypothetical protein